MYLIGIIFSCETFFELSDISKSHDMYAIIITKAFTKNFFYNKYARKNIFYLNTFQFKSHKISKKIYDKTINIHVT